MTRRIIYISFASHRKEFIFSCAPEVALLVSRTITLCIRGALGENALCRDAFVYSPTLLLEDLCVYLLLGCRSSRADGHVDKPSGA